MEMNLSLSRMYIEYRIAHMRDKTKDSLPFYHAPVPVPVPVPGRVVESTMDSRYTLAYGWSANWFTSSSSTSILVIL